MLFKHSFHQPLASGAITVTYRAWKRARVKVGNTYRLPRGLPLGVSLSQHQVDKAASNARACGVSTSDGSC